MKWCKVVRLLVWLFCSKLVWAQSAFDQRQLLFSTNFTNPKHGVNWAPQPSATIPAPSGATPGQFRGGIVYGGVTRQGIKPDPAKAMTNLAGSFAGNATILNWPRSSPINGVGTASILRAAVGAPYLAHGADYLFGEEILPPINNISGVILTSVDSNYWYPEPVTIATRVLNDTPVKYIDETHSGERYYWSNNAIKCYAIEAGQISILWRTRTGTVTPPSGLEWMDYVRVDALYYPIKSTQVIVSGVSSKAPVNMFWTKGAYKNSSSPVVVPKGIKEIKFVYNSMIPKNVLAEEIVLGGDITSSLVRDTSSVPDYYTSTISHQGDAGIQAYNREGRIFMEILGDATSLTTRAQIGFEIVEVSREPLPNNVTVELGERVTAYPGNTPSDAGLKPTTIAQNSSSFAYQHNINTIGDIELYATQVTQNSTDFQVIWGKPSMGGLVWPFLLSRYTFIWPDRADRYSHYLRPLVTDEKAASSTAIVLPIENSPALVYQDPSDSGVSRAKISAGRFYTFLEPSQPALRALIRYTSPGHVAFERVFSWIDDNVVDKRFTDNVSTTLQTVKNALSDTTLEPLPDIANSPRVVNASAYVGDRIPAPVGELGNSADYIAGYINTLKGVSFNAAAYQDPFLVGFEAANKGAIIPVNAIPGMNQLEVLWFRRSATTSTRNEQIGFKPTYWPSVIGRYTLKYPDASHPRYREIVLASNHGSGPLSSIESAGSLYIQNTTPSTVGFNPNEEHALIQGGRVWALRDDLNVTTQPDYSSQPYVLLDYADTDGRPNMATFHVVRESATDRFSYVVDAGTILQPPMPLPLLDKPVPPTAIGEIARSLNQELGFRKITDLSFINLVDNSADPANNASTLVQIAVEGTPSFASYQPLVLQNEAGTSQYHFYPGATDFRDKTFTGTLSTIGIQALLPADSTLALPSNRYRFTAADSLIAGITLGAPISLIERHGLIKKDDNELYRFYKVTNTYSLTVTGKSTAVVVNTSANPTTSTGYIEVQWDGALPLRQVSVSGTDTKPSGVNIYRDKDDNSVGSNDYAPEPEAAIAIAAAVSAVQQTQSGDINFTSVNGFPGHLRYGRSGSADLTTALGRPVIVSNPYADRNWPGTLAAVTPTYIEVAFDLVLEPESNDEILLVPPDDGSNPGGGFLVVDPITQAGPSGILAVTGHETTAFNSGWRLTAAAIMPSIGGASVSEFYNGITFQDRKQNLWVYRGPHPGQSAAAARREFHFYYKTLPGFWFPTDAAGIVLNRASGDAPVTGQPPVGTITPYLRTVATALTTGSGGVVTASPAPEGQADGVFANENAQAIIYQARWPESAPVLQMGETLTVPKRGLPAIRGQTSLEVLYQQSMAQGGDAAPTVDPANPSVVLHDPTAAKKYALYAAGDSHGLDQIPPSVKTSLYRGKSYFPQLPPHLVERFYFDPNDGQYGSLVFQGEFKQETLGESYLLSNIVGGGDLQKLQALCSDGGPLGTAWNNAIAGLSLEFQTFYPDPAKPGTFIAALQGVPQVSTKVAGDLVEVTSSDSAVDSYALTAVGPGTGYVTLIAGQGRAFTPPDEPVSLQIIKVIGTLYPGEAKVILSSNPLAEKVTFQQVLDLAGRIDDYEFQWWISAPEDGAYPPLYSNTPSNLFSSAQGPGVWQHLEFPAPGEAAGNVGSVVGQRFAVAASQVVPIRKLQYTSASDPGIPNALDLTFSTADAPKLATGVALEIHDRNGGVHAAEVTTGAGAGQTRLVAVANGTLPALADLTPNQLVYERSVAGRPQSLLYRDFQVSNAKVYPQYYLSLDLNDALGAKVYVDGQLLVSANLGTDDTGTVARPVGFAPAPLSKVYVVPASALASGSPDADGLHTNHRLAVELFSGAVPETALLFQCQLDAYETQDLVDRVGSKWLPLDPAKYPDKVRTVLGETADVRALSDNYVISRYRATNALNAAYGQGWSQWTSPALAEGWIKRVLAGINPFNQRTADLFNNTVNTDASILAAAGKRWEGDVALNLDSINNYGLIEIYETVLRRGKMLSIDAGISYDPANDALLLAAGYISDLYMMLGNEARADAANPTIGIGTKDKTYGDIATALFAFKGQLPSLLEEELALLRGRDDFLQPGVRLNPVYNRLVWNYTRGIDAGEVIYALNYNILDQNQDGKVDAQDASVLYPQGHGDAYGHYLTALKGYYSLLVDKDFAWVPRIEAVNILGKAVAVDYQDERKFAAAAAAVARTGRQVFDLTWRKDFQPGEDVGWEYFAGTRVNATQIPVPTTRSWGMDHWATRTGSGSYLNWAMGNAILPPVDPNPAHEGIQKVDRTTVPELKELAATAADLQAAMDSAEGHLTPAGLANGSLSFDLNPNQVTGPDPKAHFEQVYERALGALNNAVSSFDDAKDVTRLMRSEQDSLAELQASVDKQELAYKNALIELYGTAYSDDVGPGKLYKQGYDGPDLYHYTYVETETIEAPGIYTPNDATYVAKIDIQALNGSWSDPSNPPRTDLSTSGPADGSSSDLVIVNLGDPKYLEKDPVTGRPLYYIPYAFGSHGFFDKPKAWTSRRQSPGKIQQAISELIQAHDRMYYALAAQCESDKQDLDKAVQVFKQQLDTYNKINAAADDASAVQNSINNRQAAYDIMDKNIGVVTTGIDDALGLVLAFSDPTVGLATSIPIKSTIGPILFAVAESIKAGVLIGDAVSFTETTEANVQDLATIYTKQNQMMSLAGLQDLRQSIFDLGNWLKLVQGDFQVINEKLRIYDDTKRRYASVVAEGDRLQQERQVFRQRAAALVQGFRTRDAAFRIFRNEKLERYKTLFDLATRYTYLAANAYDYDTGLLNTPKGKEFVARIVNSRALGVIKNGNPQFAGSNLGDPGLSSVLAEMKADWDVLKGRLGFNNPTSYGTTFSLRREKFRLLKDGAGNNAWTDVLNRARKANILEDADVKRYCMQVDPGNGLPVPGLVVEFETSIADGYNFFGQPIQGFDHYFDSSSFATKIFAAGIALEGYIGMDDPMANSGAVAAAGARTTSDPDLFGDENALGATPGVYLIPVGLDSMRSPALGDSGSIRTWDVADVTIPLPFNIGASGFSGKPVYQSGDSLSEPLFGLRKHAAFRPVSTNTAFSNAIYGNAGSLQRSQFTNTRLIGRSVWNSKWKLVIPGSKLLQDPDEGLDRFIKSVKDIKLHLVTYSYSGN